MSRLRIADERGVTLVELLVVCATLGIVLAGLTNVFVSGARAGADADARFQAQQNVRIALDRLQYDARCASTATLVAGGAGVALALPAQCSHVTGTVTWCVAAGVLTRFAGATCSGAGLPYVRSVTTAAPFALPTAQLGSLPQLQITLSANTTGRASDAFGLTDTITLRNAARA